MRAPCHLKELVACQVTSCTYCQLWSTDFSQIGVSLFICLYWKKCDPMNEKIQEKIFRFKVSIGTQNMTLLVGGGGGGEIIVLHIWIGFYKDIAKLVNSSPPIATYLHHGTESSLVKITACRLFGAEPSSILNMSSHLSHPRNRLPLIKKPSEVTNRQNGFWKKIE